MAEDTPILPLQHFSEHDDAETIATKSRLVTLVHGEVTPTQAAVDFDAWLAAEADRRLHIFLQRTGADRYDVTPEEKENGVDSVRAIGPNPEGHLGDLFEGIAVLCSSFPPFHPQQDLLIAFLHALKALPPRDIPNITRNWRLYDGDTGELRVPDHPGWNMMHLWPLGEPEEDLTRFIGDAFREQAEFVYLDNITELKTPGSELRQRWINLQSFAARITAAGLADCRYICALRHVLPLRRWYPESPAQQEQEEHMIRAHTIAGAQWLLSPSEGRWVFDACKKAGDRVQEDDAWGIWNMQGWMEWKARLQWIQTNDAFDNDSRLVAKRAHQQMETYEADQ